MNYVTYCTVHEQPSKLFKSWTTYVCNVDTAAIIRSQRWFLLLVVIVYVACAQSSFDHFRTVETHASFSLQGVAAFMV